MILKLIETTKSPEIGDLVSTPYGLKVIEKELDILGYWTRKKDHFYIYNPAFDKVILPYGISGEEIRIGDKVLDKIYSDDTSFRYVITDISDQDLANSANILNVPKVVLQPHQFNYQEIVDLGLKDGDRFDIDTYSIGTRQLPIVDANDRVVISEPLVDDRYNRLSKPQPVTYTEEELDMILNEFGNELLLKLTFKEIQDSSNGIAKFVTEYLNKKKQ